MDLGLKLGHSLVKRKEKKRRPKSSSVTGVTGGVVTPKDKTRVLLPSPFVFLLPECKDTIENI